MKFITWVFKFTPWGVSQGGWGGGSPPTSLGGLSGVLQGTITTHLPAAPFSWERGLPEVQTPTPLQGLHTCSVKGHPWNGSHSGHGCAGGWAEQTSKDRAGLLGLRCPGATLWVSEQSRPFQDLFQQFLLISPINLSSHPFMSLNGGAPRSGGLGWKSLGHRRDPVGLGSGLPRDFVPVVGWGLVQGLQGGQGGLGKGSGEGQESVRIFPWQWLVCLARTPCDSWGLPSHVSPAPPF